MGVSFQNQHVNERYGMIPLYLFLWQSNYLNFRKTPWASTDVEKGRIMDFLYRLTNSSLISIASDKTNYNLKWLLLKHKGDLLAVFLTD